MGFGCTCVVQHQDHRITLAIPGLDRRFHATPDGTATADAGSPHAQADVLALRMHHQAASWNRRMMLSVPPPTRLAGSRAGGNRLLGLGHLPRRWRPCNWEVGGTCISARHVRALPATCPGTGQASARDPHRAADMPGALQGLGALHAAAGWPVACRPGLRGRHHGHVPSVSRHLRCLLGCFPASLPRSTASGHWTSVCATLSTSRSEQQGG